MSGKTVLILGARSEIAIAIAHKFAKEGYNIQLAARNAISLELYRSDIEISYQVNVTLHEFDVLNTPYHSEFINKLAPDLPEIAVCVIGYMGIQTENEQDFSAAMKVIRTNYEGPSVILGELANHFEMRGSGTIVGISSVAGERGRATNYIYGSAKSGLTAFLSGLRNRLAKKGVHVITLIPGYVATKLTNEMDISKQLLAQPDEVAECLFQAVRRKKNVVYVKPLWRFIMFIIRSIPEFIFKWMRI